MVITNPDNYQKFMDNHDYLLHLELLKKDLALEAFQHTSEYDQNIVSYFDKRIRYRKYTERDTIKYGCESLSN